MLKRLFLLLFLSSWVTVFAKSMITVTYPVQDYFIKKIAKNSVYVRIVYDSKHDFRLTNKSLVRKLSSTDYYFNFNLLNEEKLIETFTKRNSDLKLFNMIEGIPNLKDKDGNTIPYVWLDPILVRKLAFNTYEKLVEINSYNEKFLKANLDSFLDELDEIYLHVKRRFDEKEVYGFFSLSNQLDYFAKRFRLNVYHKEFRYLTAQEVPELIELVRKEHIKHLGLPANNSYLVAQSIAGHIGAKIFEYDIYDRNWKSNIFKITRHLANY